MSNKQQSTQLKLSNYIPLIITMVGVFILILLGNWQLKRLIQKNHFIATIENNIATPAQPIHQNSEQLKPYSKVAVTGKFLSGKNVFLYGRRSASPEKDGYYILSAFEAENGQVYLVSRGWIPQSIKNNPGEYFNQEIADQIEAITLPEETKGFMVPDNDNDHNIWFTIDLKMAKEVLGVTEDKYYLMQINSTSLPIGAKPLSTTHLNKVRNDHLEYAITWYSLAVCLLIVFFIYQKKRYNNKNFNFATKND
ncbi:MAG: SURF1 family protein [Rickettsiaceae bacterium]